VAKTILITCIIFVLLFAIPADAQLPGDLNCNGFYPEIGEAVLAAIFLIESCDAFILECTYENGDLDGDGLSLTIGDLLLVCNMNPYYYSQHPESDTIMVESAIASPGETIALPLWVKTVDTLVAFQFLLEIDPDYIEFDTVIVYNDFPLRQRNCYGNIYCHARVEFPYSTILLLPGNYHIADIIVTINPENEQPATTSLIFSSIPRNITFSGFANTNFFQPVMVDAEIEIIPVTDIESETETIPTNFEISVYPNPFNDAVNISVLSDRATEISVYDIVGRPVKTFAINAGNNLVKWGATDAGGRPVSAGIYFIGESGNKNSIFKKVLYLK